MTDQPTNDNDAATRAARREPDAHGQAAMLLVESLLHSLIDRSVLSLAQALEIIDTAAEVKEEVAHDLGDSAATLQASLALLKALGTSLRTELPIERI